MTNVMQQGRCQKDANIFVAKLQGWIGTHEFAEKLFGQVEDAKRVLKARMPGTGIDQVDIAQLCDIAKTLEVAGVYQGEQGGRDIYITPNRVPYGLAVIV